MNLSNRCVLEITETLDRAEKLSRGSAADRAQATVLQQKVANLRQHGLSTQEIMQKYSEGLTESLATPKFDETRLPHDVSKICSGHTWC